jgi:hypothetical protein
MLATTGFEVVERGAVDVVNEWPDVATAVRALAAAGPSVPAIEAVGYDAFCEALSEVMAIDGIERGGRWCPSEGHRGQIRPDDRPASEECLQPWGHDRCRRRRGRGRGPGRRDGCRVAPDGARQGLDPAVNTQRDDRHPPAGRLGEGHRFHHRDGGGDAGHAGHPVDDVGLDPALGHGADDP